ncbi:MAG: PKD domain-containing protein [Thermoanaerobaculales bacterium]|nr:PKD domain-containing protein [Thermoanaerobaculales bacterium]
MRRRPDLCLTLAAVALAALPAAAQHVCDSPPVLTVLTGEPLSVSGLGSQGHPSEYSWYITPPGAVPPTRPTSTNPTHSFSPGTPGLWSIDLVADYEHEGPLGGLWSSETCLTVEATSVVASIHLGATQITTAEELEIDGFASQWAPGVTPLVEWRVDGLAVGACNGGPPPVSPFDLTCTISGSWLDPGWHTAGLLLTDPVSGQSNLSTADLEVIEVVPLSVDFGWTPAEPDPGQWVHFVGVVTPAMPEQDFTEVRWDLGDGTVLVYDSCPQFWGSCLEWVHSYGTDGWYDVSLTVETATETASKAYRVKIGDPVDPPSASFTVSPSSPTILEPATFGFTGSCAGACTWLWDFGDGGQSTAANPTHTWVIPASYPVTLSVTNQSGGDDAFTTVVVGSCWQPAAPTQEGACFGGPVWLTAPAGVAWSWSTGATTQTVPGPLGGAFWVNIDSGGGCWGHAATTVALANCGDPGGDANLDGAVDAADVAALVPELTDGDGDSVATAGGGDLTAPGADATSDFHIRADDLLTGLVEIFR